MMLATRRAALLGALAVPNVARAAWPERSIRLLVPFGADPAPPNTPADFRATISGAHDQWAPLIRRLNLVAE